MSWSPGNPEKYATDHHEAETAGVNGEPPSNDNLKYLLSTDVSGPTAKVWALYVKQAEASAKEEADSRNSRVDTLLVFAGLFAGVVSSFVIGSRTTLQPNPEQILLANILSSLDQESTAPSFSSQNLTVSASSVAINVLWFSSLTLILVGSLASVMVRGWLMTFVPGTPRGSFDHACRRRLRDSKTEQWQLEAIVSIISLLIQAALFLFLLGLVIECLGDNAGIGWSILALVALTFIGYGVITILPWLFPGCPLRTPISEVGAILLQSHFWKEKPSSNGQSGPTDHHRPAIDVILKLWKRDSFVDARSRQTGRDQPSVAKGAILKFWKEEPSDDILWMDILSWMLTNSVEVEGVEEAVKVFAAIELKGRVREGLDPRVPKTLCDRLEQCFKVASENLEDLERTDACLHAILRVVEYGNEDFLKVFDRVIDKKPLGQWEDVALPWQVLFFSIQIHILVLCHRDYERDMVESKRWATMIERALPRYLRKILVTAAARGVAKGQKNLKRACILLLAKQAELPVGRQLLQPDMLGFESRNDEHVLEARLSAVLNLTRDFSKFGSVIEGTINGLWSTHGSCIRVAGAKALATFVGHPELHKSIKSAVPELVGLLTDGDVDVRAAGTEALLTLAKYTEMHEAIKFLIPNLTALFMNHEPNIQVGVVNVLSTLAEHSELRESIEPVIPDIAALLKNHDNSDIYVAVTTTLSTFAGYCEFHNSIRLSIPDVISLLSMDDNWHVQFAGADTLSTFAGDAEFHELIKPVIPELVALLQKGGWYFQSPVVKLLSSFAGHSESYEFIKPVIPVIISLLKNDDWSIQVAGAEALSALAEHVISHESMKSAVPVLIGVLNNRDESVRTAAAKALSSLAKHSNSSDFIASIISSQIKLLEQGDGDQVAGAEALSALAKHSKLPDSVERHAIPNLNALLRNRDTAAQAAGAKALSTLAVHSELHEVIKFTIPNLKALLKNHDPATHVAVADALSILAGYYEFQKPIELATPDLIALLNSKDDWNVRATVAKALATFVNHTELHESIKPAIPHLITLLKDNNWQVQIAGANALSALAGHSEFHQLIKSAIPDLISLLKDQYVCSAGAETLLSFAEHAKLLIASYIPDIIALLKDGDLNVQDAVLKVLSILAGHEELHKCIKPTIPDLIALLKDPDARDAAAKCLLLLSTHDGLVRTMSEFFADLLEVPTFNLLTDHILFALAQQGDFCSPAMATHLGLHQDPAQVNIQAAILSATSSTSLHRLYVGTQALTMLANFGRQGHTSYSSRVQELLKAKSPDVKALSARTLIALCNHVDPGSTAPVTLRESFKPAASGLITFLRDGNPDVQNAGTDALAALAEYSELHESIKSAIPNLTYLLKDRGWEVRVAGAKALQILAGHNKMHESIGLIFPDLIALLKDADPDVRLAGFEALSTLAKYLHEQDISAVVTDALAELHKSIDSAIPDLLELLKDVSWKIQAAGAKFISTLAGNLEFRGLIKAAIPDLVNLLKSSDSDVRSAGTEALFILAKYHELCKSIELAIPGLIALLKDDDPYARAAGATALPVFAGHDELRKSIELAVQDVITLLSDSDSNVRSASATALPILASHDELRKSIKLNNLNLDALLKDDDSDVRIAGAMALPILAAHVDFRNFIELAIPSLITMLKDFWVVQVAGAKALSALAGYSEFHLFIESAIPNITSLLQDRDLDVRTAGAEALSKIAEHSAFHKSINSAVRELIGLLKDRDSYVRVTGTEVLTTIAGHLVLQESIELAVSSIIALLKDHDPQLRAAAAKALPILGGYTWRKSIELNIPNLIALLKDSEPFVRVSAAKALPTLAGHEEFRKSILPAIRDLVVLLKDSNSDVRAAGTEALSTLSKDPELHESIESCIPDLVALLQDGDWRIQLAGAEALSALAEHAKLCGLVNDDMLHPISLGSLEVISRLLRLPDFLPSSDSRRLLTVILLALESLSLDKLQTPRFQAVKLKILHALCEDGLYRRPTLEVARIQSFGIIILKDSMSLDQMNRLILMMMDYGVLRSF